MALSVTYNVVNGVILSETRGGVDTIFVPDTNGSLVECRDASGNKTYSAEYWPYGEVQTETGSKANPWGFGGLVGYLRDLGNLLYVRARHLRVDLGRWQTTDPLWPGEQAYGYVSGSPVYHLDPLGLSSAVLILPGVVLGGALLEALLIILGIVLAVLLLYLLLWGLAKFLSWICGKLRKLEKDVCGDPDGRLSDVVGGCCWSDSCLTIFYKAQAYNRCAQLRMLYSLVCYGSIDPPHLEEIRKNAFQVGKCLAIFEAKCVGSMPPFGGPIRFHI